jgi:hypothetical protein
MDSVYAGGSGSWPTVRSNLGRPSTEGLDFDIDLMRPQEPEHCSESARLGFQDFKYFPWRIVIRLK